MADEGQGSTAEAVARILSERELVLGTVECGTEGAVARVLFDTEDGPAVLSDSLRVDTIEEAVDALELPAAQFKSSGEFSAKAVRAAARQGRTLLDVDLCLAVCMLPMPSQAAAVRETAYVALDDGQNLAERTLQYEGASDAMAVWVAGQALALVHESLRGRRGAQVH
ncbi:MAG TPA: CinA family protein [Anaerolineae bacterium]|nr:CinA family protein [Anaerolineae bacterium]